MNTNKDDEFLLWIAKRLVYKYHENLEILSIVTKIIEKNQLILKTLQSTQHSILTDLVHSKELSEKIIYLTETNMQEFQNNLRQIKMNVVSDSFENLDISEILENGT